MFLRNIFKIIFVVFALAFLVSGCKSKQKIVSKVNTLYEQTVLQEVSDEFLSFETFSAKLKVDGSFLDKRKPLKSALRIQRDSIIWISVNLSSGIPIAKLAFTKDSVKVLDRIKDELYIGDYEFINKKFNINLNYNLVQSILINEVASCDDEDSIKVKRDIVELSDIYTINCTASTEEQNIYRVNYVVNKGSKKIESANFMVNNAGYNVKYSEFEDVEGKLFPSLISYIDEKRIPVLDIEIELSKVTLNNRQKYPFKISKKVTILSKNVIN